jgi:hypothetical protein
MVRQLRERMGKTYLEFAHLLGWVSTGSVFNIERGTQNIGERLAGKLEAIAAKAKPPAAPRPAPPTMPRVETSAPAAPRYTPQPPRTAPRPAKPPTVPLPRQPGHRFAANRCECAHTKWEHENDTGHCLNLVCQRQAAGCQRYRPRAAAQPPARPA